MALILRLASGAEHVFVSQQRPVGASLVEYSRGLPLSAGADADTAPGYSLVGLARDLLAHARANFTSNGVVVPVLQTFNVLLEADALRRLPQDSQGDTRSVVASMYVSGLYPNTCAAPSLQELLSIVTRNVGRLKSIQRIHESMKM